MTVRSHPFTSLAGVGVLALVGCANVDVVVPFTPTAVAPQTQAAHATLLAPAQVDWPMFRDDPERSGFAEGTKLGDRAQIAWSVGAFNRSGYGAVKGSPSVADGILYCGTDTGRFVALRATDGEMMWSTQIPGTTHGIHGSPAIAGELVYIAAYDGVLYALARATGAVVWTFKRGYQAGASPDVVPEWGLVFSAHETPSGGGTIVALDGHSGALEWEQPTLANPHASVAVDVGRDAAFAADNRGMVYAFDSHDGTPRWRRDLRDEDKTAKVKATPAVFASRGLVLVTAWSGKVYALSEEDGKTAWEHEVGGSIMGSVALSPNRGRVYVGSPRGVLYALDAGDGHELWSFKADARVMSSPAVSGDERAIVFGAGDRLYAVAADDGHLAWSVQLDGEITGSPTLVGSRIYVTSARGSLWAVETAGA